MPVTEAIILAGGLGTRLRSAIPDLPKCMAPVNGKPFIGYVVDHLRTNGIRHFIFSLGYRSEAFLDFLKASLLEEQYQVITEKEPLGTGGAIQLGLKAAVSDQVMALNGDSIFKIDIRQQAAFHIQHDADCTLALKPLTDFDRYGAVVLGADNEIVSFKEKQYFREGLINGGVYTLNRERFLSENLPEKFSFETDYLQRLNPDRKILGLPQDAYFIDIGIPEDYQRAQAEL